MWCWRLCSKNEDTKSESNSQHCSWTEYFWGYCVQRTKIQNLKAIHNRTPSSARPRSIVFKERRYKIWKQFTTCQGYWTFYWPLCSKNEDTKSESNSQPRRCLSRPAAHCVQRTKIQNLKAIHNLLGLIRLRCVIVFKERRYKIWKQFTTSGTFTFTFTVDYSFTLHQCTFGSTHLKP